MERYIIQEKSKKEEDRIDIESYESVRESLSRLKKEIRDKEKRREATNKAFERRKRKKRIEYHKATQKLRRKRINRRYYLKTRVVLTKRKKKKKQKQPTGQKKGYFSVIITKDGYKYQRVVTSFWMSHAYRVFKEKADDYAENVIGEKDYTSHRDTRTRKYYFDGPHTYELLLLRKIPKDADEDAVSWIRDESGKAVKHIVVDMPGYVIEEKARWGIPDSYYVYGYDKQKDRKTGKWIMDNLICSGDRDDLSVKAMLYGEKIIIQKGVDFDLVICRGYDDAGKLYRALERYASRKKMTWVFFTGELTPLLASRWIKRIKRKTGWLDRRCGKNDIASK